jgi:hypothetical protein
VPLYAFAAFSSLMGFGAVSEFERKLAAIIDAELSRPSQ